MEKNPEETINYYAFNQEQACISIGTNNGFKIIAVNPFTLLYSFEGPSVSIVEMLYNTNIIAVVGMNERVIFTPRRLTVWDTNSQSSRIDFSFNLPILYVKMNKQRLIVGTNLTIDIYNLIDMKKLASLDIDGGLAKLALTPGNDSSYLAYTFNSAVGDIILYDLTRCCRATTLAAYKKPVVQMQFNQQGKLLATACSDGKVIRIFSVPSGRRLYSLHRGIHAAEIHSMSFDQTSSLLGLTSMRGTFHIFKFGVHERPRVEANLEQEFNSDEEAVNNYKKDNKNDSDEDSDKEVETSSSGCCGGWCGLKFLANKLGSIFVDDPSETWTAVNSIVKFTGENIKKPNILGFDKERKAIMFCKDGSYYEYVFDESKNEVTEVASSSMANLRNAPE